MTTLVTGATGFLGSAIARELLRDGRKIKLLARSNADLRNIEGLEAEVVVGDLRNRESLKSALQGCSKLYHAAAFYSLWSKDKKLIYDINVQGTRNILEMALSAGASSAHFGGALSITEIISTLFACQMKIDKKIIKVVDFDKEKKSKENNLNKKIKIKTF